ncbi:hypothetical protein [Nocardioides sp. B-3]|uniref:hypothetical protein n=1 Tax=Nocardioides sp. B-3 TaxID=2895565 RepID=UPI002152FA83|nr:hypothetical protein [Nocardioides sp. B-3]UUZ58944.1 hypothetical protein LP418_23330 [Nocardioides sp. B-3]
MSGELTPRAPQEHHMARRDPADFAEFVAARSPALHRAAYLMVGERGLARDLVRRP